MHRLEISIKNLRQCSGQLSTLAQWQQHQWGGQNQSSLDDRGQRLRSHLKDGALPNTWIALYQGEFVGSVSILKHSFHQDDRPSAWLSNLFVVPRMRNQGIGSQLVQYAEDMADSFSLQRLFLFTNEKREFYERQHWNFLYQARVSGEWVEVMEKTLDPELFCIQLDLCGLEGAQQKQAGKSLFVR